MNWKEWYEEQQYNRFQWIVILMMATMGIGIVIGFFTDEMNHNEHTVKITYPNGTTVVREIYRR